MWDTWLYLHGGTLAMIDKALGVDAGILLEGRLTLPAADKGKPVGLYIACGADHGSAILLHAGGRSELGPMKANGSGFRAESRVDREMHFGRTPAFRLLLKNSLLEFYLNDVLIDCFSLPEPATGRIGLIGEVSGMKAWQL